jgi:hypothetical protein
MIAGTLLQLTIESNRNLDFFKAMKTVHILEGVPLQCEFWFDDQYEIDQEATDMILDAEDWFELMDEAA